MRAQRALVTAMQLHRGMRSRGGVAVLMVLLPVMLAKCWLLTQGLGRDGYSTYVWAGWQYNEEARFDNTWLTWATDYMIAAICMLKVLQLQLMVRKPSVLCTRCQALLIVYAISTVLGGAVHQLHDGHFADLNTVWFRMSWTLVVSLTALAGSIFGLIANEVLLLNAKSCTVTPASTLAHNSNSNWTHRCARQLFPAVTTHTTSASTIAQLRPGSLSKSITQQVPVNLFLSWAQALTNRSSPLVSDAAWIGWGIALIVLIVTGAFSCMRPACDIFIAGASQTIPTFYLQLVLLKCRDKVPRSSWWGLQASLLGNCPLIFLYPALVQRSGLSLGWINALLHAVLACSWSGQGAGLLCVCKSMHQCALSVTTNTASSDFRLACPVQQQFSSSHLPSRFVRQVTPS